VSNLKHSCYETHLKEDLAEEVLPGRPNPEEKDGGMDGCKEGTVEPSSTLGNKLGDLGL